MNRVTSSTKFLGLIGFPIRHSLSPQIHNYLFEKYNVDAVYGCFEVKNLKETVRGLVSLGFVGFNVTIPYKEKIIKYLDYIDKETALIGAVNTVKIHKGKLYGYNTDGKGFLKSLESLGFVSRGKSILILGAGGAAKSISVYLAKKKVDKIAFYDIVYQKAYRLAKKIYRLFKISSSAIKDKNSIKLSEFDLLVNATGVGLKKGDPLVIELAGFKKNLVVYDLIYNPLFTPLLKEAKKKGLFVINGLEMLIWQALEAERIWFGIGDKNDAQALYKRLYSFLRKC